MHSILAGQSCQTNIHEQEIICIITSFARRMHGQYEGFIVKTICSTMKHACSYNLWLAAEKMKLATTDKNRYHRQEECH